MADVEPGTPIEVRISDGGAGSLLVPAVSLSVGDLNNLIDALKVADRGPTYPNVKLTTNATNIGEARVTSAQSAAAAAIADTRLTGLADFTPQDLGTFRDTGLWSLDEASHQLSISTALVRTQYGVYPLASKPQNLRLDILDGVAPDTLSIELRSRGPLPGDDFPALAEILVSTNDQGIPGTRRQVSIDLAPLVFAPGQGRLLQLSLTTKGGGGPPIAYALYNVHWRY